MPVLSSHLPGSVEAPRQFAQSSRKGKKAWRKNVDVTDVERGLDELNREIIRGGVIREKDSADLFTIDLGGDSSAIKKYPKHSKKYLKADEILAQRSAIPSVSARKRPGEISDSLIPRQKRLRQGWVSHKELVRLRKVADGQHAQLIEVHDASYDVWDDSQSTPKTDEKFDFLPEPEAAKLPKTMKQKPISLIAGGKEMPAVPKPSGGFSYNPLATDYETRLVEESAKAVEAEKQRLLTEEAEREKQDAAMRSAAEAEAAEQRANLSEWEEDSEWEGFQSGAEEEQVKAKQPRRKTQAQRNRIKRRKEEERLAKSKAATRARKAQEEKIEQLADEVEQEQMSRALSKAEVVETSDEVLDDRLRRRQLGKFKLPDRDLELVLPDELEESLRRLKPEGNLLKDRYRSMLVRGKMESRRHLPFRKQAKRKVTEKWSYKDFHL